MAERFIGTHGYNRQMNKIVNKILKAYNEFGLISNLKKADGGYRFLCSQERMNLLNNEIKISFMEAGLI